MCKGTNKQLLKVNVCLFLLTIGLETVHTHRERTDDKIKVLSSFGNER